MEDAWDKVLQLKEANNVLQGALLEMRHLDLLRTSRLQRDIRNIHEKTSPATTTSLLQQSDIERLQNCSSVLQERIFTSVMTRPHILLAYMWTMYLALFNGGRWIRRQLNSAGTEFWLSDASHNQLPLSFWDFSGTDEGESVKVKFKQLFDQAAETLTDDEKDQVVSESFRLFATCADLVTLLDQLFARASETDAIYGPSISTLANCPVTKTLRQQSPELLLHETQSLKSHTAQQHNFSPWPASGFEIKNSLFKNLWRPIASACTFWEGFASLTLSRNANDIEVD